MRLLCHEREEETALEDTPKTQDPSGSISIIIASKLNNMGHSYPSRSKAGHEQVCAGDQAFGRSSAQPHTDSRNTVQTAGHDLTVRRENASIGEHPGCHQGRADDEGRTSSPSIKPDQRRDGHEDIDNVLDRGGKKVGVALIACHGEDVGNVVHCLVLAQRVGKAWR